MLVDSIHPKLLKLIPVRTPSFQIQFNLVERIDAASKIFQGICNQKKCVDVFGLYAIAKTPALTINPEILEIVIRFLLIS